MDIKQRVNEELPEIKKNIRELVAVPSILAKAEDGCPFGKANAEALAKALEILKGYGFRTANLDNYAGYAEIGQGAKVIGMVGHLDVVPVSKGWASDPFTVDERDGRLIGRGTSDDKGPVACAMAALRIVSELRPGLTKRIRLVMGCNEESGSRGLAHYVEREGDFDLGFTPDGSFPGVYGEKGGLNAHFSCESAKILDAQGGDAPNVVCGEARFTIARGSFDEGLLQNYFDSRNIRYDLKDNGSALELTVIGRKAHASMPHLGVNAISEAFTALDAAGMKDPAVAFYARHIGTTCHGERAGIDQHDAYGELTFNVGMISKASGKVTGTIDIRYPVTKNPEAMLAQFRKAFSDDPDGTVTVDELVHPLFYSPDSPLVQTLLKAYQRVTGDKAHLPITMGGGTYAKGIKNTIAFGAEFPDDPDVNMHGDNEFIPLANLAKQTEIYVYALLDLIDLE